MAPTAIHVDWQTSEIIKCLFADEEEIKVRQFDDGLESDSVDCADDHFDPVLIADKLRSVADSINDDVIFRAALTELKQAAVQEAVEAAFSHGVKALCQTHVSQRTEVAPEIQLIQASVAFGLYVKKSCPELKNTVQGAMAAFLNRRVNPWLVQKGGWVEQVSLRPFYSDRGKPQ